jgi:hypothetical protein
MEGKPNKSGAMLADVSVSNSEESSDNQVETKTTREDIGVQAEKLVETIINKKYLEKQDLEKAVSVAEMFPLSVDRLNELVDKCKDPRLAVRVAKLGISQDRIEKLFVIGTRDAAFILNMSLEEILTLSKLGVSESARESAIDFVLRHGEAYGYGASWNAALSFIDGFSVEAIDRMVYKFKYDLDRMINVARLGASTSRREEVVKRCIEDGALAFAIKAARVAGRELTETERITTVKSGEEHIKNYVEKGDWSRARDFAGYAGRELTEKERNTMQQIIDDKQKARETK